MAGEGSWNWDSHDWDSNDWDSWTWGPSEWSEGSTGKGKGKGKGKPQEKGKGKDHHRDSWQEDWREEPTNSRERRLVSRDLARLLTEVPEAPAARLQWSPWPRFWCVRSLLRLQPLLPQQLQPHRLQSLLHPLQHQALPLSPLPLWGDCSMEALHLHLRLLQFHLHLRLLQFHLGLHLLQFLLSGMSL